MPAAPHRPPSRAPRAIALSVALLAAASAVSGAAADGVTGPPSAPAAGEVSTFSIVAADPGTGEVGVAVASRFFAVGAVVPWARAGAGAAATQAYANTSWGPRSLDLLAAGLTPEEIVEVLKRSDPDSARRQLGLVASDGRSASFTGPGCTPWAGGRAGKNYAVQGNILAGEGVVVAMEKAFLETKGDLAERLYAALVAGEGAGGDTRGRQSAALVVHRERGGYGGFNDRAIDIRVDDHPAPFLELGRILRIGRMWDSWNRGWTLFTEKKYPEALAWQEKTASLDPDNPEVLYDLAVIRLAAGDRPGAIEALRHALAGNPKLKAQAKADGDLEALHGDELFESLTR